MPQAAAIFGLKGTALSPEEASFFHDINPYGFILFARNCESPAQVRRLTDSLRDISGRDVLPVLIDQEGGRVARLKPPHWPAFPPAKLFADLYEKDEHAALGACCLNARLIAHELYQLGITVDCAPVADVPVSGAHDIIGDRAFGHTAEKVAELAGAQAEGLMEGGVIPVVKHIPGHGRACADSHEELPVVDASLALLRKTDFAAFKDLADLPMAMTAHVLFTAIDEAQPVTLSERGIALIREEIRFKGLLMSDDLSMKALGGDFTSRTQAALAAGCDVVLHCNGEMNEMQAIAEGLKSLDGQPQLRAEAALRSLNTPKPFDVAKARRELAQLLTQAA